MAVVHLAKARKRPSMAAVVCSLKKMFALQTCGAGSILPRALETAFYGFRFLEFGG